MKKKDEHAIIYTDPLKRSEDNEVVKVGSSSGRDKLDSEVELNVQSERLAKLSSQFMEMEAMWGELDNLIDRISGHLKGSLN